MNTPPASTPQTPPTSLEDAIRQLERVTARLRAPDGCPWDRNQTHASLAGGLIEECHEVVDAIHDDDAENLREELGDLLLHVLLHAQIASENKRFSLEDVLRELHAKLIRRHPHVFGNIQAGSPDEVVNVWEQTKQAEGKNRPSAIDGIPRSLPALLKAVKAGRKAARHGLDWQTPGQVLEKVREEIDELAYAMQKNDHPAIDEEIGDLLFSVANLARHLERDPEHLAHNATAKFANRFRKLEAACKERGVIMRDQSPEALDSLWREAKTSC